MRLFWQSSQRFILFFISKRSCKLYRVRYTSRVGGSNIESVFSVRDHILTFARKTFFFITRLWLKRRMLESHSDILFHSTCKGKTINKWDFLYSGYPGRESLLTQLYEAQSGFLVTVFKLFPWPPSNVYLGMFELEISSKDIKTSYHYVTLLVVSRGM